MSTLNDTQRKSLKMDTGSFVNTYRFSKLMSVFWSREHTHILFVFHFDSVGKLYLSMMTWSNGNIFRVTGSLWGEPTSHWWVLSCHLETWNIIFARPLSNIFYFLNWTYRSQYYTKTACAFYRYSTIDQGLICGIVGPRFNVKMPSYPYRKCHCEDK